MTTAASDPQIVPRPPAAAPALRAADQGVADALTSVLSDNTRRVYGAQWRLFTDWCDSVSVSLMNTLSLSESMPRTGKGSCPAIASSPAATRDCSLASMGTASARPVHTSVATRLQTKEPPMLSPSSGPPGQSPENPVGADFSQQRYTPEHCDRAAGCVGVRAGWPPWRERVSATDPGEAALAASNRFRTSGSRSSGWPSTESLLQTDPVPSNVNSYVYQPFLARPEVRRHNRRASHKIALLPTAGVRREHSNSTTRNQDSG